MTLSCCVSSSQICTSLRTDLPSNSSCRSYVRQRRNSELYGQQVAGKGENLQIGWNFLGGSRTISRPNFRRICISRRKSSAVYASWIPSSEIASIAFTSGTAAVLPFYTLMVVAPKTEFVLNCFLLHRKQTKKVVGSSIPYVVLGILYCYLLYLSWTPDTIRLMFASKYWLPELPGIANLFSGEMTLVSAWIHLLAVDLFAARQVYNDGLRNNIETRHSVSLCLMSCPIGILAHLITKAILIRSRGGRRRTEVTDKVSIHLIDSEIHL